MERHGFSGLDEPPRPLGRMDEKDGMDIDHVSLQQLAQHCPHLKTLQLWNVELTQNVMDALGQHCYQLEQLDLHECSAETTHLFEPLVRCPLKKIWIDNTEIGYGWEEATVVRLASLLLLTHLNVQDGSTKVRDRFLSMAACATWPRLTRLSMDYLEDIGDDQLIPLIRSHPQLQHLALKESQLTDKTLDTMATCLPHLTHLDLEASNGITVTGLRRLVQRCPQLESIHLRFCPFSSIDFPEAGDDYLASLERNASCLVNHLDQATLCEMRREWQNWRWEW